MHLLTTTGTEPVIVHKAALTADELKVLRLSAELFNAAMALPNKHPSDADELTRDIHNIQNRVMARLAVRAHPDFFNQS